MIKFMLMLIAVVFAEKNRGPIYYREGPSGYAVPHKIVKRYEPAKVIQIVFDRHVPDTADTYEYEYSHTRPEVTKDLRVKEFIMNDLKLVPNYSADLFSDFSVKDLSSDQYLFLLNTQK